MREAWAQEGWCAAPEPATRGQERGRRPALQSSDPSPARGDPPHIGLGEHRRRGESGGSWRLVNPQREED